AFLCLFLWSAAATVSAENESLRELSDDFWTWRARNAPFTRDDVNRLERPGGRRDWSAGSVEKRRSDLERFEARWKAIVPNEWPIADQVDYRLVGSALARVRWELEINPRWKRDPTFYLDQTLTALAEALTIPPPFNGAQSKEILTRIENIPAILQRGLVNLETPPAPFPMVAIQPLDGIRERLQTAAKALQPSTTLSTQTLDAAMAPAADALEKFQAELKAGLPKFPQQTALGRQPYVFFLRKVALYPYSPEEILAMGQQEWNRAVAFETYERERNRAVSPLKVADNLEKWIKDSATKELEVRDFLKTHEILTLPDWFQHYTLRPMPAYLRSLGFTEPDDFTGPSRLDKDCVRWTDPPSPNLGYFWRATAQDPRPICVHEGIPGHY